MFRLKDLRRPVWRIVVKGTFWEGGLRSRGGETKVNGVDSEGALETG